MQLLILLDRTGRESVTAQLIEQLKEAIVQNRVGYGVRLPSSRSLADQLGIARNTVTRAYDALVLEEFIESKPAAGMFVSWRPRQAVAAHQSTEGLADRPLQEFHSGGDDEVKRLIQVRDARLLVDFLPDQIDSSLFPLKMWRRLIDGCLSHGATTHLSTPGDPAGLVDLRKSISDHLAASHGIVADAARILITSGRLEAISVAAKVFLSSGNRVVVEDPCYLGAARAFQSVGASLHAVSVDHEGIAVAELNESQASLAYLTPSHQYPTAVMMSEERRKALISWANKSNVVLVEDDYGGEFRDEEMCLAPLITMAPERTVFIGSFASSLGPSLQVAFMVLPQQWMHRARLVKAFLNQNTYWLPQAALAEMLRNGSFASYLMRLRAHYRETKNCLVSSLREQFGDVAISGANAGLQLFWQLPPGVPQASHFEMQARKARIGVYSLSRAPVYTENVPDLVRRGILLGFGGLNQGQIEKGVRRLSDSIDDALDNRSISLDELLIDLPPNGRSGTRISRKRSPAQRNKNKPALRDVSNSQATSLSTSATNEALSMAVVKGLFYYPIKGLSAQSLPGVELAAGQRFPRDREFAVARPGGPLKRENPGWAKKGLFVMLMLDEALAQVSTHLDMESMKLTVSRGDSVVLSANISEIDGRIEVEKFLESLVPDLLESPMLVRSIDSHFMDKPDNVISLINLATVRDLELRLGARINPLRFRANLYVDTGYPWEEFEWVGEDIQVGDVSFSVDRRNGRCGATNVDPETGSRDMDIPGSLRALFGHKDFGVYLKVKSGGKVVVGDEIVRPVSGNTSSNLAPAPETGGQKYICRGCYFIYSDEAGIPLNGVPTGTPFNDLPSTWRCPDCGTDKGKFRPYTALRTAEQTIKAE